MSNSDLATLLCIKCRKPLVEYDKYRSTCHACRSPKGKVADLDIATRASGDNPKRIREWRPIRYFLTKRFGACDAEGKLRSDADLLECGKDWLEAEGKLESADVLQLPLDRFKCIVDAGLENLSQQTAGSNPASRRKEGKARGRKKPDGETVQREEKLAAEWVRARVNRVYKADFAKEQRMTLKEFDRLLDRVAARKRTSE